MNRILGIPTMCTVLVLLFVACGQVGDTGSNKTSNGSIILNGSAAKPDQTIPEQSPDKDATETTDGQNKLPEVSDAVSGMEDGITPTQLLCYMIGNAEEFSYSYKIEGGGEERTFRHFYKDGKTALYFHAVDINGQDQPVREVEQDGRVFYVMEGKRTVVSYKSPASDILLQEMQAVCMNAYDGSYEENGKSVFEYLVPNQQESGITKVYRFLMDENRLKELDILFDPSKPENRQHYTFTEFLFEPVDEKVFEVPAEYGSTQYDTELYSDEIPPWFE